MLMSKSRLEKFLYALYSLDSSDLPTPLSRIEELYKCWVTGEEVPTFEPISRTEKYLMAILGGYDVNSLPNPLSRVEVLLYKLATGDDNLDDVRSFLSEHEELLAEIIRNGGVGGNIDIEYVLYTLSTGYSPLYNTAEKPVKSAFLKGQTLVNLWNNNGQHSIAPNSWTEQVGECFKKSTKYLLKYNVLQTNTDNSLLVQYYQNDSWLVNSSTFTKLNEDYYIFTTPSTDFNTIRLYYYDGFGTETVILKDIMLIEYQDGMENLDIPYFEGMKSVQMPVLTTIGKNLFDGELKIGTIFSNGTTGAIEDCLRSSNYIKLEQNIDYVISNDKGYSHVIFGYNSNKEFVERIGSYSGNGVFKLTGNIEYIMFRSSDTLKQNDLSVKYQIEKGTVATPFEPYKSNILTVNEPVELRGIGDVKDELDLITGKLTQRVGEVVLDGSQDGLYDYATDVSLDLLTIRLPKIPNMMSAGSNIYGLLSDKYVSVTKRTPGNIYSYNGRIMLTKSLSELESFNTQDKIKLFLSQNPITVQYPLATPIIKTVDLSVVDQYGNDTELSTFDDITHVTLSSEGLILEAELEVATKNEEVLNTMSLEMDDISTTQNALQETSNTQSENVDATMLATTEIYEGLL